MPKIVAYQHEAKPFNSRQGALFDAVEWLRNDAEGRSQVRWTLRAVTGTEAAGFFVSLDHIYGGAPQWLSNEQDEAP